MDHRYAAHLTWTGTTAVGYEGYDRTHRARTGSGQELTLSADPAFLGVGSLVNPEELLLLAAASCQLLSFLAVAARARIEVIGYRDDASARLSQDDSPARVTDIVLRPSIHVARSADAQRVGHLVEVAHRECFIARSLRCEIRIEPTVIVGPPAEDLPE